MSTRSHEYSAKCSPLQRHELKLRPKNFVILPYCAFCCSHGNCSIWNWQRPHTQDRIVFTKVDLSYGCTFDWIPDLKTRETRITARVLGHGCFDR